MKTLDYVGRVDGARLAAVAGHYTAIKPYVFELRCAYVNYLAKHAIGLTNVSISAGAEDALRLAYSSKAKGAKLAWITELHSGHSLHHCPLCGGPGARTIDHHLPQAEYAEYAVFSANLVPSCGVCNPKRGSSNKPGNITTLHPYFDQSIMNVPLVYADIEMPFDFPTFKLVTTPAAKMFDIDRIKRHLDVSIDEAALSTWLRGVWGDFRSKRVIKHNNVDTLRGELIDTLKIDARLGNQNSWHAALMRGIVIKPQVMNWLILNQLG